MRMHRPSLMLPHRQVRSRQQRPRLRRWHGGLRGGLPRRTRHTSVFRDASATSRASSSPPQLARSPSAWESTPVGRIIKQIIVRCPGGAQRLLRSFGKMRRHNTEFRCDGCTTNRDLASTALIVSGRFCAYGRMLDAHAYVRCADSSSRVICRVYTL